ncbi:MAG: S-ribosylhomocysteine lyase [Clostridia bacterium]
MNRIKSFSVDHRKLDVGVYISRIDGDIVTYDMRFRKPNTGSVLDNASIHTTEHMLATFARNSDIANDVIYFGPMGCQTGFYLLVRDNISSGEVLALIKDILKKTLDYEGEVFGASEEECGNYRNLDLDAAKRICGEYLDKIKNLEKIIDYDEV